MDSHQTPSQPLQTGKDDADQFPQEAAPLERDEEAFYIIENEGDEQNAGGPYAGADAPFQASAAAYYTMNAATPGFSGQMPPASPALPAKPKPRRWPRLLLYVGLPTVIIVLVLAFVLTAMAAQTPPVAKSAATTTTGQPIVQAHPTATAPKPQAGPTVVPTPAATAAAQGGSIGQVTGWVPQHLPAGWTNAGLSTSDAVEAERTSLAFTDREEGLDFRSMGTRAAHGGTFTTATFILTPAAKARFRQNDVRVINNTLFDRVAQQQLIQAVVDATPKLVQFQAVGNQQFAWVDVSYHLWQSRIDPTHATARSEGVDVDAATNQPRVHHMLVLLLRVAPAVQGPAAPMGGTGWLVSTYALDQGGLPDIVQPA